MLEQLDIHNYALIEHIAIRFDHGLNVLSGETGAGKSILVDALGLLLGQKGDSGAIRSGATEALVSGVVRVRGNPEALAWLESHSVMPESGSIMLRRIVKKNGRGSIFVESVPITRSELAELAILLFDMHGQHDHQSLLDMNNHRKLLDRFGNTEELALEVTELYLELTSLKDSYGKAVGAERERLREIDLLKYACQEIDQADLKVGEEEELEKEYKILTNHEKLILLLDEIYRDTAEGRGGCLANLRRSRESLEKIIQIDPGFAKLENQLQDAFYELEDFSESIRAYSSSFKFDPLKLSATEERLFLIRELEKKYGNSVQDVLDYADKCRNDLEELQNWESRKKELEEKIARLEGELKRRAAELSERRKLTASDIQRQIEEELLNLGMLKARFRILVQDRKDERGGISINQYGMDRIEFVISTNPGEPFKRLRKIASGGELSRIMLAIKSILAESDHISTLIFDEVDAGIGGEVALSVGERLRKLSVSKQILCITHLATIAARADNHIKVEKVTGDGRTKTLATVVSGDGKIHEISRMLSGDAENEVALQHAEELLRRGDRID